MHCTMQLLSQVLFIRFFSKPLLIIYFEPRTVFELEIKTSPRQVNKGYEMHPIEMTPREGDQLHCGNMGIIIMRKVTIVMFLHDHVLSEQKDWQPGSKDD